ncbi:MAG: hypothetical protein J0H50_11715 [Xanthomonadales bacterium]|nr:hypothetical protein [Xanthomonadales bacterium]
MRARDDRDKSIRARRGVPVDRRDDLVDGIDRHRQHALQAAAARGQFRFNHTQRSVQLANVAEVFKILHVHLHREVATNRVRVGVPSQYVTAQCMRQNLSGERSPLAQ